MKHGDTGPPRGDRAHREHPHRPLDTEHHPRPTRAAPWRAHPPQTRARKRRSGASRTPWRTPGWTRGAQGEPPRRERPGETRPPGRHPPRPTRSSPSPRSAFPERPTEPTGHQRTLVDAPPPTRRPHRRKPTSERVYAFTPCTRRPQAEDPTLPQSPLRDQARLRGHHARPPNAHSAPVSTLPRRGRPAPARAISLWTNRASIRPTRANPEHTGRPPSAPDSPRGAARRPWMARTRPAEHENPFPAGVSESPIMHIMSSRRCGRPSATTDTPPTAAFSDPSPPMTPTTPHPRPTPTEEPHAAQGPSGHHPDSTHPTKTKSDDARTISDHRSSRLPHARTEQTRHPDSPPHAPDPQAPPGRPRTPASLQRIGGPLQCEPRTRRPHHQNHTSTRRRPYPTASAHHTAPTTTAATTRTATNDNHHHDRPANRAHTVSPTTDNPTHHNTGIDHDQATPATA